MASAPLTHAQIWTALDRLAARAKLSPSGLAKRSGLDPTTFNKSKRITPDGRARWPSTESVAKALAATSVSVESFVSLIAESQRRRAGGAADRLRRGRRRRLFRRRRLPGRQRLGRDRVSRGDRRARLCAGDFRRVDDAGLSRRRRHHRVAGGAGAARRPRRGQDQERRGHGQGAQAPDREAGRAEIAQRRAPRPHAVAGGRGVDRAHRLGEPVARLRSAG